MLNNVAMIGVQFLAYFAAYSLVLFAAFLGYAKLLYFVVRFSRSVRLLLGLGIYLAMSCALVSPLLVLSVNESWRSAVNLSPLFAVLFLLCYLLSVFPGALHFKLRHLARLKALGYFKSRSYR